tara:strand:- start:1200 stop:1487 length:288 start_codon:yes stop_codon:yes gene_type:complete
MLILLVIIKINILLFQTYCTLSTIIMLSVAAAAARPGVTPAPVPSLRPGSLVATLRLDCDLATLFVTTTGGSVSLPPIATRMGEQASPKPTLIQI